MEGFSLDYLILAFVASCGVLQIAAAYGRLRGMLLLGGPGSSAILGLALIMASFLWFFLSEPRNISDTEGGLDGNQQAALFAAGAGAALVVTLVGSSLRNLGLKASQGTLNGGLDVLREANYFSALYQGLRSRWERWRRSM